MKSSAVSPHSGASAFSFAYDEFGRSTSVEVTDLEAARTLVTNRYNSRSLLDRQLYGNGHSVNFVYDALDRLVGKGYNDTAPVFTYGYDLEGRLARI